MKANQLKNGFKILTILFAYLLFISCSKSNSNYKESIDVSESDINTSYAAIETNKEQSVLISQNQPLKIIKSAQAKYKVINVKETTTLIKKLVAKHEAYISDLRFEDNLYKKENRFTIKIPACYFDILIDSIGTLVEFTDYQNITTQDVTEEFIDVQTRLKTKLEVKERYESILRKNAKTVEDILLTEDKLRIIQEEIEVAQGRLQYLTNKVSYSTIQVDLYETVNYKEKPTTYRKEFGIKLKDGLYFGWKIIENVIIGLFHIWSLLLILIFVLFIIKLKKNKRA